MRRYAGATARALALVGTLALGACSFFSKDDDKAYAEAPVEQLYNRALDSLGSSDYKNAAKGFEEVDRQHPYSVLSLIHI